MASLEQFFEETWNFCKTYEILSNHKAASNKLELNKTASLALISFCRIFRKLDENNNYLNSTASETLSKLEVQYYAGEISGLIEGLFSYIDIVSDLNDRKQNKFYVVLESDLCKLHWIMEKVI